MKKPIRKRMPSGKYCEIYDRDWVGLCIHADHKMTEIVLEPDDRDAWYLDTAIHEMLHALHPSWTEKKVAKESAFMSDVLTRLGFRRPKRKKK